MMDEAILSTDSVPRVAVHRLLAMELVLAYRSRVEDSARGDTRRVRLLVAFTPGNVRERVIAGAMTLFVEYARFAKWRVDRAESWARGVLSMQRKQVRS